MADITKCAGTGCPVKDDCYRHTAPESMLQSYFVHVPLKEDNCGHYWADRRDESFEDAVRRRREMLERSEGSETLPDADGGDNNDGGIKDIS